jgi:ATP-dependent DNA ligase
MAENNFRADRLEEAIHSYGIEFDEKVKWDNEKMIKLLGDYFISLEPDKYSWGARYVQSLATPMLCKHMKDDLDKFEVSPLESEDYVAETKLNGMRVLCSYSPEVGFEFFSRRESSSNFLNGNFTNKFLFIEKGLISEPKDYVNKFNYRFVIDGELLIEGIEDEIQTTQVSIEDYIQSVFSSNVERAREFQKDGHKLKMMVFDVLYFEKNPSIPAEWTPKYEYGERDITPDVIQWVEGHYSKYLKSAGFKSAGRAKKLYQYLYTLKDSNKNDVRRYPFSKRRELRHLLTKMLNSNLLPFYEVDGEDVSKISFLEEILSSAGEGIILKNVYAPYISTMRSSRGHRAAMKVKQSISTMLSKENSSLMEDFDVFITGANPPKSDRIKDMIGSLSCSVYIKKKDGTMVEHEIANVSGISHEWKKKLACVDVETGKISLNPEYEGRVISIDGLALTSTKLKFQHATLKGKVLEFKAKNPSECTWDEDTLKEMTLTRGQ